MNVSPLGQSSPITRLHGSTAIQKTAQGSQDAGAAGQDTVEISDVARYLSELKSLPEIREDKVASIRKALEEGTYDVSGKLDTVVSRVLEDLA